MGKLKKLKAEKERHRDCRVCEYKNTSFYYGFCPLPQDGNRCYKEKILLESQKSI